MFDSVEDAVQACRADIIVHHRAAELGDVQAMDGAAARIRSVVVYLRARERTELIHPLTMEWATEGRDHGEHARFRAVVDLLLHASPDRPTTQGPPASEPQADPTCSPALRKVQPREAQS